MTNQSIRELRPDDDFHAIVQLQKTTFNRIRSQIRKRDDVNFMDTAESLQQMFFPVGSVSPHKGFVALDDDNAIVAMMSVLISATSKNGYIQFGVEAGQEPILGQLLTRCSDAVRQTGGSKLCRFTYLYPGQIRNAEIFSWESFGFVSDDYYFAQMHMKLEEWTLPEDLDVSGVEPVKDEEMNGIYNMLKEDGGDFLADRFREAFTEQTPDHVVLMLKDKDANVVGAAYYQVSPSVHPSFGTLTARAFGAHFRHNASLSQKERRRYLQAVIASMKQLGVDFTFGRFSSRNFDTIVQLVAEGFEYGNLAELRLVKSVQ